MPAAGAGSTCAPMTHLQGRLPAARAHRPVNFPGILPGA